MTNRTTRMRPEQGTARTRPTRRDTSVGILLVNTGAPSTCKVSDIRSWLASTSADPRINHLPALLRYPAAYLGIAPFQASKLAPRYERIWTDQGFLYDHASDRIREGVITALAQRGVRNTFVLLAQRHSAPSIQDAFRHFRDRGIRRVLVVPLLPHHSFMATESIFDEVERQMRRLNYRPDCRRIADYHKDSGYLDAIAASVAKDFLYIPDVTKTVFLYPAIPYRDIAQGDTYEIQTSASSLAIAERLNFKRTDWTIGYQPHPKAPAKWLAPTSYDVLDRFSSAGITDVRLVCPGYPCDRLETLLDVREGLQSYYQRACKRKGVPLQNLSFHYVPALNGARVQVDFIAKLICEKVDDWLEVIPRSSE